MFCHSRITRGYRAGEDLRSENDWQSYVNESRGSTDVGIFFVGYVEVFESNSDEMAQLLKSPNSNDQQSNSSNTNVENWREPVVRLRGLPYNSSKEDVTRFFNGR